MSNTARWAVLGAGEISGDFLRALPHARLGALHAVGARDAARARAFADEFGGAVAGTYEEILGRDDVDAVYIGTVHTSHRELAIAALAAGKAEIATSSLDAQFNQLEDVGELTEVEARLAALKSGGTAAPALEQ